MRAIDLLNFASFNQQRRGGGLLPERSIGPSVADSSSALVLALPAVIRRGTMPARPRDVRIQTSPSPLRGVLKKAKLSMAYLNTLLFRKTAIGVAVKNGVCRSTGWFIGLLLTVVLLASSVGAAEYSWKFAGWHGGGCYPQVVYDAQVKDRVYLTSDVAGIFRSDDGGEHWRIINEGLTNWHVAAITVAQSNSELLFAATKGGVFVSKNGGARWEKTGAKVGESDFDRPDSNRPLAVNPANDKQVCLGTLTGSVQCSEDVGTTWKDLAFPLTSEKTAVRAIQFTGDASKLLVATPKGLWSYDFLTQSWVLLLKDVSVVDMAQSAARPERFYALGGGSLWNSNDGGKSWQTFSQVPRGKAIRLAVDETVDPPKVYAVWQENWDGGVVVTVDGGSSWQPLPEKYTPDLKNGPTRLWARNGGRTTSLRINPYDAKTMIKTDWWGVWKSQDGGLSWKEIINGAPNTVGSDIIFDGDGGLWTATMDNGLLASFDSGHTYGAKFPFKGYHPEINGHVWRVASLGKGKILATSSPWEDKVNQVILSQDQGKTFSIVREGLPSKRPTQNTMWGEGFARALAVDPQNPDVVYLGIDGDDGGGLFISTNGGQSWKRSPGQPGALRVYNGLSIDPDNSQRIFWGAAGDQGGVFVSEDQGRTWFKALSDLVWVFDVKAVGGGVALAAGSLNSKGVIYISRDQGQTFKPLKEFNAGSAAEAIAVDPRDPLRLVVSTVHWGHFAPGKIFFSSNGGKDWKDMTGNLPVGPGVAAATFSPDSKELYVILYAGSVYKISLE